MNSKQLSRTCVNSFSLVWEINNFLAVDAKRIESTRFSCPSNRHVYYLTLYPKGEREEDKDFVSIFLIYDLKNAREGKIVARHTVALLGEDGTRFNAIDTGFHTFSMSTYFNYGLYKFIRLQEILQKPGILPKGRLRVFVEIQEFTDCLHECKYGNTRIIN